MPIDAELAREVERSILLREQARALIAKCAWQRATQLPLRRRETMPLLALTEHLIAAHILAKKEGDGLTIDVILDALHHIGKRLAKETRSHGRSARRILGYDGQEHAGGPHRDGSVSL